MGSTHATASASRSPLPAGDPDMDWLNERYGAINVHLMHLRANREFYEREGIDRIE